MQNQFQPEENQPPPPTPARRRGEQTASLTVPETPRANETEIDPQTQQAVAERLEAITKRANRAERQFWMGFAGWSVFLFASLLFLLPFLWAANPYFAYAIPLLIFTPLIAMFLGDVVRARAIPKFNAEDIAKLGGVKAVAPLIATAGNPLSKKQKQAIFNALTSLLMQLKASDSHLLMPSSRYIVHTWLSVSKEGIFSVGCSNDLHIAALKALKQVGDSSAIPYVEALTKIALRAPDGSKIQQAAIDCLPALYANCRDAEAARTLLRASQAEAADPATLLRPASGAGTTDGSDLLRGTEPPETRE